MLGLACLGIAVLCALVSRGVLVAAAFSVSRAWGVGVFLPFGPLLFRLSYPEQAARARVFGLIALPCYLGFIAFGPGLSLSSLPLHRGAIEKDLATTSKPVSFASEDESASHRPAQNPPLLPNDRRAANEAEFARLRAWSEKLLLTKRDLLRSDTESAKRYNEEATRFNSALAAANAEKAALDAMH